MGFGLGAPFDQIKALQDLVYAIVPLIVQGQAIGVLAADRKYNRLRFEPATIDALQNLAKAGGLGSRARQALRGGSTRPQPKPQPCGGLSCFCTGGEGAPTLRQDRCDCSGWRSLGNGLVGSRASAGILARPFLASGGGYCG